MERAIDAELAMHTLAVFSAVEMATGDRTRKCEKSYDVSAVTIGYEQGIKDALAMLHDMPTIEPKQEWISVKDELPEEGRRVLVSLTLNRSYTDIDTDRVIDGNWRRWGIDVTHWMPLPEPPETK